MIERTVTISNEQGLHARPAALLVERAKALSAKITLTVGTKKASATSIMSVLALGATTGDVVTIVADGDDEAAALDAVEGILTSHEDEL